MVGIVRRTGLSTECVVTHISYNTVCVLSHCKLTLVLVLAVLQGFRPLETRGRPSSESSVAQIEREWRP